MGLTRMIDADGLFVACPLNHFESCVYECAYIGKIANAPYERAVRYACMAASSSINLETTDRTRVIPKALQKESN